VKISTSWGTGKAARKRKRPIHRTKIRWDLLGLQDPGRMASPPSMEDIRRQIISMASHGLGPDTRLRSGAKDASAADVTRSTSTRKRRRGAAE
jgi:hypothetical protein